MLRHNGSNKPPDYEPQELSDDDIRWVRGWRATTEHLRWLWRTILRPVVITALATLAGAPAVISGLKELFKFWAGK